MPVERLPGWCPDCAREVEVCDHGNGVVVCSRCKAELGALSRVTAHRDWHLGCSVADVVRCPYGCGDTLRVKPPQGDLFRRRP